MYPFETPAIEPGSMYMVRAACTFAREPFTKDDREIGLFETATFETVDGGTLLFALGCVKKDTLREGERGSQFLFKFLWGEKEVFLPLVCKEAVGPKSTLELHEELEQSLGLFVRRLYVDDNNKHVI